MSAFTPQTWYWLRDDGLIYSGASQGTVPSTDAGYVAAFAADRVTAWPRDDGGAQSNAALYEALRPYGLGAALAPPPSQADLVAYAAAKQAALQNGGITVNVGTSSTPVVANVDTDGQGQSDCAGNIQMIGIAAQLGKPAPSFAWDNGKGAVLTIDVAQMQAISWALNSYRQATRDALADVYAAIVDGAIADEAGIDAASWPATGY